MKLNSIYKKKCKRLVGTNEVVLHAKVARKFIQTLSRGDPLPTKAYGVYKYDTKDVRYSNYMFYFDMLKYTGIHCPIIRGAFPKPKLQTWSPLNWYKSLAAIVVGSKHLKKKSLENIEKLMIQHLGRVPTDARPRFTEIIQKRLESITQKYLEYDLTKNFTPISPLQLLDRHKAPRDVKAVLPHTKTTRVIPKGKFYYTYPGSDTPLIGFHGSYDPPTDMDGHIFLP